VLADLGKWSHCIFILHVNPDSLYGVLKFCSNSVRKKVYDRIAQKDRQNIKRFIIAGGGGLGRRKRSNGATRKTQSQKQDPNRYGTYPILTGIGENKPVLAHRLTA
jgi:hypothetical protein